MRVADVKRQFKEVLDAALHGESTVVLRYGKPVATIGPVQDAMSRPGLPKHKRPGGLLALMGVCDDWETMEEDMAAVIAERRQDFGRPLPPSFD